MLVSRLRVLMSMSLSFTEPSCHLDTHADTCAFGKHCRILHTYSDSVDVAGFHQSFKALRDVRIATVAVAYDCPLNHETFLLIFDHVLYIPSMESNLICVDQLREHGVVVNDIPLIRLPPADRTSESHSILCDGLQIPLLFEKPISFFPCRRPTIAECAGHSSVHRIQMTSPTGWDPYNPLDTKTEERLRQEHQGDTASHRFSSVRSSPRYVSVHALTLATALGDNVRCTISGIQTSGKNSIVKPDQLARRWRCSIDCARRTLQKTTQRAVRDWSSVTGARRFRPTQFQLEYPRIRADVHVDVKKGPCKSIDGNTCVAVYATSFQWARAYGLKTESQVSESLKNLFRDFGFPRVLRPDHAESLTAGEFRRIANKGQVPIRPHEPYRPDQNLAEDTIREGTRMYHRFMSSRNIPKACWDRVFIYSLELRSHMALGHPMQEGECGATIISGNTADVSHLVDFSIYDWCWVLSPTHSSQDNKQLCRWLGPSFDVGSDLCFVCLTARGRYLHRTSVIPLNALERNSEDIKELKKKFTEELTNNLPTGRSESISRGDSDEIDLRFMRPLDGEDDDSTPEFERYEDDHLDKDDEPFEAAPDEEENPVEFDKYVGMKVREQTDHSGIRFGIVRGRKREGPDGPYVGRYHENQFLDTSLYDVEWDDGSTDVYRANQIVESMLTNVDEEGYTLTHMKEIIDHRRDASAVKADDGYIYTKGGVRKPRRTTKGWKLCCDLHGGGTEWIDLKTLKEAYPVQVAEYAVANKLVSEPAFAWWVPYTLKKRDRILMAVKRRAMTRKTEKFGIEVPGPGPNGVRRAYEIDIETSTDLWAKGMEKEVKTVLPALEILDEGASVPPGFSKIDLMTVFDVKMDLTRKARICARGDQTDPPLSVTYASVVSRESIRIGLLLAALNDLNVLSADIAGAYLNAPCAEKIYTVLGAEFGDLRGRTAIVRKALYGLKSSGYSWRSTLARTLREGLGFTQCQGDMDCWRRPAQKKNGQKYYEYLFVYVDDVIAISEDPRAILDKLNLFYTLKPGSIEEPKTFLGATISKRILPGTDYVTWCIGSKDYLIEALRVVKSRLSAKKYNLRLKTKTSATLPSGYKPELDGTEFTDSDTATFYMQMIGILRWLVELGRIDIAAEVSMMSSYNAMPRVGHFHAVLHIFAYLENNVDWQLAMDCDYKNWNELPKQNWHEFYPWAKDEKPKGMPNPYGKPVQLTMFVDASHAANVVTRQSRTGVLIFVNSAPVLWYSKKQNSVETSSFGSEFMALKTAVELLEGLRYKLRMMGVPLEGYAFVFVDNQSVLANTSRPESTLKKKSNSIAYNYCRSVAAADIYRSGYVPTDQNWSDMLTKIHTGPKRAELREGIMYPGDTESKKEAKRQVAWLRKFYD